MALTVGLDFGTHQTKICIENSDDPLHKTYEFFKWKDGSYAFPSIIQINKDHTIRYGSVKLSNCLIARKKKSSVTPPSLNLPQKPSPPNIRKPRKRIRPEMPVASVEIDGIIHQIPYSELYGIGKKIPKKTDYEAYNTWFKLCNSINNAFNQYYNQWLTLNRLCPNTYSEPQRPDLPEEPFLEGYDYDFNPNLLASILQKQEYTEWQRRIELIEKREKAELRPYERAWADYEKKLQEWENECARLKNLYDVQNDLFVKSFEEEPLVFRYFKQATFSSYKWDFEIKAEDLSILYLANIIFQLEERFGTNFAIQMGIPASEASFTRLKKYASLILIKALKLVEDVFENDYTAFKETPYEELLSKIPDVVYSDELKEEYGIIILPEAFASLRSITKGAKIPHGMSVMLDVGGGTTDISFFVIETNGDPHIYHYESIAKGLNFFLEFPNNGKPNDMTVKREMEDLSQSDFDSAYQEYKRSINSVIQHLTSFLHSDTISRGFKKSAFTDAIQDRPVIYSGGGSYDARLRNSVLNFTDVTYIDKRILGIRNVVDEKNIDIPYSILATSYGLSIATESDEIKVSKKEELFAKYNLREDYNDNWSAHREHGMYED